MHITVLNIDWGTGVLSNADIVQERISVGPQKWFMRKCGETNQKDLCFVSYKGLEVMTCRQEQVWMPRCGFLTPFSNKRSQGSLEKWLDLQLGQGLYRASLELRVVQKIRKYLNQTTYSKGVWQGQEPTERAPYGQNWTDFHSKVKQYHSITQSVKCIFL